MRAQNWWWCAVAVLFLGGCNCIGTDFDLTRTFSVHASGEDALCQTDRVKVSLADDQTFNELKGNIGKLTLKKITLKVVNPRTDERSRATLGNGSVRTSEADTGEALTLGTWGDVPIEAGITRDIPFDKASADTLTSLALNPPHTFYLEAEGCNDQVPAFYDFQVVLTIFIGLTI